MTSRIRIPHHVPRRRAILAIVAAICLVAVPVSLASGPTTVSSARNSKLGKILVNAHGYTLYMFTRDTRGSSTCSGSCARYWVPLLGGAVAAKSGAGLNSRLLKLSTRSDGGRQATYNNHPLYLYKGDHAAGQTTGEGANEYGGHWYAVNTAGNEVTPKHSGGNCNPVCSGY